MLLHVYAASSAYLIAGKLARKNERKRKDVAIRFQRVHVPFVADHSAAGENANTTRRRDTERGGCISQHPAS